MVLWKFLVLQKVKCGTRTSLLVPLSELSLALWLELVVVQLWVVQGLLAWFCPQTWSHQEVQWSSTKFSKCSDMFRYVLMFWIHLNCCILLAFFCYQLEQHLFWRQGHTMCISCQSFIALATDLPNMCSRLEPHHLAPSHSFSSARLVLCGVCWAFFSAVVLCGLLIWPKTLWAQNLPSPKELNLWKLNLKLWKCCVSEKESCRGNSNRRAGTQKPSDC